MTCWIGLHLWGRWSAPVKAIVTQPGDYGGTYRCAQSRECMDCGRVQYRFLPYVSEQGDA